MLSLAFAAVLSSTGASVTAASVPARPLPLRGAMLRSPKTPGLMRTRSVDGRRASACKRDCIISSGSRPTTDSRSYFRAKRVKSLKCRGLPSRRRTSNAASRNVILDKPRGADAPNFERGGNSSVECRSKGGAGALFTSEKSGLSRDMTACTARRPVKRGERSQGVLPLPSRTCQVDRCGGPSQNLQTPPRGGCASVRPS